MGDLTYSLHGPACVYNCALIHHGKLSARLTTEMAPITKYAQTL